VNWHAGSFSCLQTALKSAGFTGVTATNSQTNPYPSSKGLSTGQVVGIAVGVGGGCLAICAALVTYYFRRRSSLHHPRVTPTESLSGLPPASYATQNQTPYAKPGVAVPDEYGSYTQQHKSVQPSAPSAYAHGYYNAVPQEVENGVNSYSVQAYPPMQPQPVPYQPHHY
jgi:hypothetical protein